MTVTITTTGGDVFLAFSCTFNVLGSDSFDVALFANGVEIAGSRRHVEYISALILAITPGSIPGYTTSIVALVTSVSAAAHTYTARWSRVGGTARAVTTERSLSVLEIPT